MSDGRFHLLFLSSFISVFLSRLEFGALHQTSQTPEKPNTASEERREYSIKSSSLLRFME